MSSIVSRQKFQLTVTETFSAAEMPASGESARSVAYDQFNEDKTLNATSTPPATKSWSNKLTNGQTLDFTALTRTIGATVDATNLKLQQIIVNNLSASVVVAIAKGASNGYAFNGATEGKTIVAGGSWMEFFNDKLTDVDATHKTIDITATGDYEMTLVFG